MTFDNLAAVELESEKAIKEDKYKSKRDDSWE